MPAGAGESSPLLFPFWSETARRDAVESSCFIAADLRCKTCPAFPFSSWSGTWAKTKGSQVQTTLSSRSVVFFPVPSINPCSCQFFRSNSLALLPQKSRLRRVLVRCQNLTGKLRAARNFFICISPQSIFVACPVQFRQGIPLISNLRGPLRGFWDWAQMKQMSSTAFSGSRRHQLDEGAKLSPLMRRQLQDPRRKLGESLPPAQEVNVRDRACQWRPAVKSPRLQRWSAKKPSVGRVANSSEEINACVVYVSTRDQDVISFIFWVLEESSICNFGMRSFDLIS